MKKINGSITAPMGFVANGYHCGVKKQNKKDLAMIFTETPAKAAAVFTTNVVKAAPILWNQKITENSLPVHAIIVNSGNANACTGKQGILDVENMAKETAKNLNIDKHSVIVTSTGVIGVPLPMDEILQGIPPLSKILTDDLTSGTSAANAIKTTDTYHKEVAYEISIQNKAVIIGGMAKGSGMIHPNMATMLGFITTDINISHSLLNCVLKEVVQDTFNMISVDGDTSTNDQVTILANGCANNPEITEMDKDFDIFKECILQVCTELAQMIAKDGEGASKYITVKVSEAKSKSDARVLSKSVVSSSLVKAAFFGEDANWGRIIAALGYSGAIFDPSLISITLVNCVNSIVMLEKGNPVKFDEEIAKQILSTENITVEIKMNQGTADATAWGCDLTYDYVKINACYRT